MTRANCERARSGAALAPDGELSAVEMRRLREHTRVCGACAAFAHRIEVLTAMLRDAPHEQRPRRRATLPAASPSPATPGASTSPGRTI